jgi:hypothetical protein
VTKKLPVLLVAEPGLEPTYAQPGDAGADLRAAVDAVIPAMGRLTVRTGVSIALPDGYVGLVILEVVCQPNTESLCSMRREPLMPDIAAKSR